jgi:glc operon protein GlcG
MQSKNVAATMEAVMLGLRGSCLHAIVVVLLLLAAARAQEPSPGAPAQLLSLAEARAIIDGAIGYARAKNMRMGVAVVDVGGELISGDRMDDASSRNVRFAEAKAFASAMYRQTTEKLSALYKTRPDRYFGIMNMYGNRVYLVGGGVPIPLDDKLVGAVGVAGLPQGEDEAAARAGIAAWERLRPSLRK